MINDLLLIIENCQGCNESNMLSTKEEFTAFLQHKGMIDLVDDVAFLLDNDNAKFSWKSLNTVTGVLDFRCCRDERDLCHFLDGEYNDSKGKMRDRGLHTFGSFGDFEWNVSSSAFSPRSISMLSALRKGNPDLEARCNKLFAEKSSLDDIIRNCSNYQSNLKQSGISRVGVYARD